jgi:hypothetical protein
MRVVGGLDMRKFAKYTVSTALFLNAAVLSASTKEGANDFRIVPVYASEAVVDSIPVENKKPCADFKDAGHRNPFHLETVTPRKLYALKCFSRFQLQDVNISGVEYLDPGDNVAISIKTLLFKDFEETGEDILGKIFGTNTKGEIAIVANVTQGVRSPGGLNAEGQIDGRVVYYGNDILRGQFANEFNIPLFGPTPLVDGPLTIDIWVLELDKAETRQFAPILKTLSGIATRGLGLAIGEEKILNQIGSAFLTGNDDDIIGHFTLTLVPKRLTTKMADPILQVSDIIISRTKARPKGIDFDDCAYEPLQGAVYCNKGLADYSNIIENNTFILSVRKVSSSASIVPNVSLADFNDRLSRSTSLSEFSATMESVADSLLTSGITQEALRRVEKLSALNEQTAAQRNEAYQLATLFQCSVVANKMKVEGLSNTEVFSQYCGSGFQKRSVSNDDLSRLTTAILRGTLVEASDLMEGAVIGVPPYGISILGEIREKLIAKLIGKPT